MRTQPIRFTFALLALVACAATLSAQALTTPPPGANQRAVVTQYMGMVSVTIDYNAPDVTSPAGDDRTGKIWGELVPWGIAPNPFYPGFGTAEEMPWRAGSNENTTITFSHDVEIEGEPLAAGKYALFMAPGEGVVRHPERSAHRQDRRWRHRDGLSHRRVKHVYKHKILLER